MTTLTRPPQLAVFYDALESAVTSNLPDTSRSHRAAETIFSRLRKTTGKLQEPTPSHLPVNKYLAQCLQNPTSSPPISKLAMTLKNLDPLLMWQQRIGADAVGGAFVEGHANTMMTGPNGMEKRYDVLVGASLLAPNVDYPKHDHPPEEFYVVIAEGDWYNADDGWYATRPGDVIFHRSGIRHTMRAGDKPVLAVWCLWVD